MLNFIYDLKAWLNFVFCFATVKWLFCDTNYVAGALTEDLSTIRSRLRIEGQSMLCDASFLRMETSITGILTKGGEAFIVQSIH